MPSQTFLVVRLVVNIYKPSFVEKDPIYYSEGLFDVDGDCFLVGTYI